MSNNSKPIYRKLLRGGISAAVFENTRDGRTYRSVNLQRSYRKGNEWVRMSIYLDHEHIPFMIEALDATWKFLNGDLMPLEEESDPVDSSDSQEPIGEAA
ncbi:MAG: hypothetical protein KDA87_23215 [Planctomycetales bacterium]|nr:hypothetical protein [Planctomycetales bacterium]